MVKRCEGHIASPTPPKPRPHGWVWVVGEGSQTSCRAQVSSSSREPTAWGGTSSAGGFQEKWDGTEQSLCGATGSPGDKSHAGSRGCWGSRPRPHVLSAEFTAGLAGPREQDLQRSRSVHVEVGRGSQAVLTCCLQTTDVKRQALL